jgi:hypothetical protein
MAKAKRQAVKPIPNPRTAQQPPAQTGEDLMRALGNMIPLATPLSPERSSDVTPKHKGRGK